MHLFVRPLGNFERFLACKVKKKEEEIDLIK